MFEGERIAIYCRTSSEDQAERDTVQAQKTFLRQYADLYKLIVIDDYIDEGVSGTVPMPARAEGSRLINDAKLHRFNTVIVYRVDRLSRSLRVLIEAHDILKAANITVRSATEPFDTSAAIGSFLFQLLGSMAELEKATISERTALGRQRIARRDEWPGGALPFGYNLKNRHLVISNEPYAGMTEAEFMRDLFKRISEGSTIFAECQRLNNTGIIPIKRFGPDQIREYTTWYPARISRMLHSKAYVGELTYHSALSPVIIKIPAIVSIDIFNSVQSQLSKNLQKRQAIVRQNLLRGLIKCRECGSSFVRRPDGKTRYYYKCNSWTNEKTRCHAKFLPAIPLETQIWNASLEVIQNPQPLFAEARAEIKQRQKDQQYPERQRRQYLAQLQDLGQQRQRIMEFVGRGKIRFEDAELQYERLSKEEANIRQMIQSIQTQQDLIETYTQYLNEAEKILAGFRSRLPVDDYAGRREILEYMIGGLVIETRGIGRKKQAYVYFSFKIGKVAVLPFLLRRR
jgi:site-specific DNA recombinase